MNGSSPKTAEQEDSERWRRLEKVYAAATRGELDESYAQWARDYDRDVMAMGYMSPTLVACMTARHVPQTSGLLDAGCGTGLLGLMLAALGYPRVSGIDMNEAMLAIARKRSVYENCRKMILGERLDFPDATFGAVVAAGVFYGRSCPTAFFRRIDQNCGPARLCGLGSAGRRRCRRSLSRGLCGRRGQELASGCRKRGFSGVSVVAGRGACAQYCACLSDDLNARDQRVSRRAKKAKRSNR